MKPIRELPTIDVSIAPVTKALGERRDALLQHARRALRKLGESRWPETRTARLQWLWRRMLNGQIEEFRIYDVLWLARWLGHDPVSLLDDRYPGRRGSLEWTPSMWVRHVDAQVRARIAAMRKHEKTPVLTLSTKLYNLCLAMARMDCDIADLAPVVAAPEDREIRYRQKPGKLFRTKRMKRLDAERRARSSAAKGARLAGTLGG